MYQQQTKPALYTPETIAFVRKAARSLAPAAIARELGWSIARLGRVARRHGIEIVIDRPVTELAVMPVEIKPAATARQCKAITWTTANYVIHRKAAVHYGGKTVEVQPGELKVLICLARADGPLDGSTLAERAELRLLVLSTRITTLRRKLASIGLSISSGRPDGYRILV